MKLPGLKELKEESALWVVPSYVAAYFIDSHANSFYFSWLVGLATSESRAAMLVGHCLGFIFLSAIATCLFAGYYYALKFLDWNFTKGFLSPVIAYALLAVGLLGLEPILTKATASGLNPFWHLSAFAHGFFTIRVWGEIEP